MNKKILEPIITRFVDVSIDNNGSCDICPLYNPLKPCPTSEIITINATDPEKFYPMDYDECKEMLMKAILANE